MPIPPPGGYRLHGTSPLLPGWDLRRDVAVGPEWNIVWSPGVIVPFIDRPDPLTPGPSTGFYCDGAGHFELWVLGVLVAWGYCEPLP